MTRSSQAVEARAMDINTLPPVSTKMTARQFLSLPEDGKQYELIDGEVFVMPSPGELHQRLVARIWRGFDEYFDRHEAGRAYVAPFDVRFDEANVYQPDVVVVLEEHAGRVTAKRVEGAPDLVVEVLSAGTAVKDRNVKLRAYARFGVTEAWLVDAERRRFEIHRLREDGTYALVKTVGEDGTLTTPLLPGLRMKVAKLYR